MIDIAKLVASSNMEPRPYQGRVMTKSLQMMGGYWKNRQGEVERAARSVMVESPTGSGKTVMGLGVAKYMQDNANQFGCDELLVCWSTMRRNVLQQAAGENVERGFNVKLELLSMFATNIPSELLFENRRSGLKVMMIPDECQHDATDSMAAIYAAIKPDFALGLSATPYRSDRAKLCFEKIVRDAGIHALIREGYLSQFDHFVLPDWKPETVAEQYIARSGYWGKSLMFFQDYAKCLRFHQLVSDAGLRCDIVTGDTDRDAQIEALETGKLDCLVNMYVLTEGFDCPSLESVFVRDSGKGPTVQMAGRVLRKWENKRKKIVQSNETGHTFLKTAMAVNQWQLRDGLWRSVELNPKVGAFTESMRSALLASPPPTLPAFLMNQKKKGRGKMGKDPKTSQGTESGLAQSHFPGDRSFVGPGPRVRITRTS